MTHRFSKRRLFRRSSHIPAACNPDAVVTILGGVTATLGQLWNARQSGQEPFMREAALAYLVHAGYVIEEMPDGSRAVMYRGRGHGG